MAQVMEEGVHGRQLHAVARGLRLNLSFGSPFLTVAGPTHQ
jgi:hypothetical protein